MACIASCIITKYYKLHLGDEEEAEELKHLEPFEVKQRMKSILESMDQNKDGLIDRKELTDKLLETYG